MEAHYLRHVCAQQEWPEGTTIERYVESLRQTVSDPASGAFLSRYFSHVQVGFVGRPGRWRGLGGADWLLVEYRVDLGHWTTGFQPRRGLLYLEQDKKREGLRWLRPPRRAA
ncbi:MAG: hypothetical protein HY691_00815 [Chloroflexi bacterium]|nr:hypothetical protein [Chloroflexota bacterium]